MVCKNGSAKKDQMTVNHLVAGSNIALRRGYFVKSVMLDSPAIIVLVAVWGSGWVN